MYIAAIRVNKNFTSVFDWIHYTSINKSIHRTCLFPSRRMINGHGVNNQRMKLDTSISNIILIQHVYTIYTKTMHLADCN